MNLEPILRPHRKAVHPRCISVFLCLWFGLSAGNAAEAVDFAKDVRPIFNNHCTSCHGGVKRAGGISFLSREGALSKGKSGARAIVPGDVSASEVLRRIATTNLDDRMPPPDHGGALPESDIQHLREWIRDGAAWTKHWAYEKPLKPSLPAIRDTHWPRQDLDRFVLARLEFENLLPAKEASRAEWLRRVSFDLTGLPPSEKDVESFLSDMSTAAYESVVDRLLTSPRFGERWASPWLDLARYADTMGYERDYSRVVWPWRDWVIRAFNSGMQYDEFILRQLAGDLLPGATDDDRLATAFHRNTQTNTEDGTDDEEFRIAAVIDRIGTTWEGLAATSMRCVQCHNHPYDPFPQEEFYKFAALFNTTRDHDANEDFPLLRLATHESDRANFAAVQAKRDAVRRRLHSEGMALARDTRWRQLRPSSAKSTGQATISLRESPNDGVPEVTASGTITLHSVYTIDIPMPDEAEMTALRLEVLPDDEEKAISLPELGFVLSSLQAQTVPATASTKADAIPFVAAYDEDPEAFFPVEASLNPDAAGWSAYPRFHRRRSAVFVPKAPVHFPPGSSLRLQLAQDVQSSGIKAQAIRRIRFAVSDDDSWMRLAGAHAAGRLEVKALDAQLDAIPSVRVPVMAEQPPSQLRDTRVFQRGNWLSKGAAVGPGVPSIFGAAPVRNRLELARWMTSAEHPLFARVAVNRFWEQLFGLGLVESSEEFGTTGREPSHPELLDWLAVRFATDLRFSVRGLLREIVLSATYRQEARSSPSLQERDPRNRLLARGPRQRLSAEMIRDQALAVSGLLSSKIGGPPVMPVQPEGIWRTVYNGGKWETSPGEDAHRRAIYTFIRRTSGYPSFQTFDAPSREFCTTRRLPTNTPLQALVTLNDPVYMEAAGALARRMSEIAADPKQQIAYGWLRILGRPANAVELEPLTDLHKQAVERFTLDPKSARALAESTELAAMTIVANALFNLDAALTR